MRRGATARFCKEGGGFGRIGVVVDGCLLQTSWVRRGEREGNRQLKSKGTRIMKNNGVEAVYTTSILLYTQKEGKMHASNNEGFNLSSRERKG